MSASDMLLVNFTISAQAKQAAEKRALHDEKFPDDAAAALCVGWGI
jgi:hypothetical protein